MLIMSSDVRKGLEGVVVDETAISKADIHSLTYRGYPVQELAQHCNFEEVAYLIWNGDLPNAVELETFRQEEIKPREISVRLTAVIHGFSHTAHPMDCLRTAVSHLGMEAVDVMDNSPVANRNKAVRLFAQIPTIIAADYRYRQGLERIAPRPDLSFAANFFNMCFGQTPSQEVLDCFEVALILYAEHGFNPSTFTARIVASTLSDMYSAITAAIGSLKGSLHGER
ncbi:MAG: citrate/2-methylcitrate synthase [Candidatus Competibacteraceae bacterium]